MKFYSTEWFDHHTTLDNIASELDHARECLDSFLSSLPEKDSQGRPIDTLEGGAALDALETLVETATALCSQAEDLADETGRLENADAPDLLQDFIDDEYGVDSRWQRQPPWAHFLTDVGKVLRKKAAQARDPREQERYLIAADYLEVASDTVSTPTPRPVPPALLTTGYIL